ncbi:C-C motif chemokine 36.1 [Tautogolabrus adspersus]
MRSAHVLLLCMLGAALLSSVLCSSAIGPNNCCFKFYPRRMNKNVVRSYFMTDERCPKTGAILVTMKARHICADPNLSWVESIMKSVDEKSF